MTSPRLPEYLVAGYFVTRPRPRHEGFNDPDLVPPKVVTASPCFGTALPDGLAGPTWEDEGRRRECAEALGIPFERMAGIARFLEERARDGTWLFSFLLADLDRARELCALAEPDGGELGVYAMALDRSEVDRLLDASHGPTASAPWVGRPSTAAGVSLGRSPIAGGRPLGHELLTHCGGCDPSCSWLCSASEKGVAATLGIRTNVHGLIESHDDAIRAARWIDEDESRGEPGPWFAWLLLSY